MKYRVQLSVASDWVLEVEADDPEQAYERAKLDYRASENPWNDFESNGDETIRFKAAVEVATGKVAL